MPVAAWRRVLKPIGIVLVAAVLIYAFVWCVLIFSESSRTGEERERIAGCTPLVAGLADFHAANGTWPQALDDLPAKTLASAHCQASYTRAPDGYTLTVFWARAFKHSCTYTPLTQWQCP